MLETITRNQIKEIEARIKLKKEDDEKELTEKDRILEMFFPIKTGIRLNGLTVRQITKGVGRDNSYRSICYIRTRVCQLASDMIKEGKPFGGIKVGKEKKYGFPSATETREIVDDRKIRMFKEFRAGEKYLEDSDPLKKIGKKFSDECNRQLELYVDGEDY